MTHDTRQILQRIRSGSPPSTTPDSARPHVAQIKRVLGLDAEKVTTARFEGQLIGVWVAGVELTRRQMAALGASGLPIER